MGYVRGPSSQLARSPALGDESPAPIAAQSVALGDVDSQPSGLFIPGWMLLTLGIGIPVLMTYAGVHAYGRSKRRESQG